MKWLPLVASLILLLAFQTYDRVCMKQSGHHLLPTIPTRMIFSFLAGFVLFSALGFAEGGPFPRDLAVSAGAGISLSILVGWNSSRKKLR